MLPISVTSKPASFESNLSGKRAEGCRAASQGLVQRCGAQVASKLRRIATAAVLPFLMVGCLLACASTASAQKPAKVIVTVGPLGIQVTFEACYVSTDANCPQTVPGYSIYRNPPGFGSSPWAYANLGNNGYSYQGTFMDQKQITTGQTYTYKVCTGLSADSDGSNCLQASPVTVSKPAPPPAPKPTVKLTNDGLPMAYGDNGLIWSSTNATSLNLQPGVGNVNVPAGSITVHGTQATTYTITATGPGGTATASTVTCPAMLPPQNLSVYSYDIELKWTNPQQPACQEIPSNTNVTIARGLLPGGLAYIATLNATNGVLPGHYIDQGTYGALPHAPYQYLVCNGGGGLGLPNCALSAVTFRWGTDPVLTATRVNANTVQLKIAVDEAEDVSMISVTRQGSDDPCRQGQQLGNGLQGCPTVGPNGTSVAQTTTVYNWSASGAVQSPPGLQNSKSAPYVISLPNDTTVKPGVEYYYLAQVGWATGNVSGPVQTSETATVPSFYGVLARQQSLAGGITPVKQGSGAPPPSSQSGAAPARAATPMTQAIAPAASSVRMTAAPPPQTVTAARPMLAPMATQTAPMLQPGRPMMSATPSAATPPLAQPNTAMRPTAAPGNASTARMIPSAKPVEALPGAANLAAAIKEVQQKPHDPQALYALGKAYCASKLKNAGVSDMYMALQLAEQAHNTALATQIKGSLAAEGVSAK